MAKKVKACPGWLATFADLMSLLMAVFVLLFAMSSTDEKKYIEVIQSLNATLVGSDGLSEEQKLYINLIRSRDESQADSDKPEDQESQIDDLHPLYESLLKTYSTSNHATGVKVDFDTKKNEIKLVFPEQISFSPGKAKLKPHFSQLLKSSFSWQTGEVVVKVIGHTDKRPVGGGRFQSNWELSSARAASVVVLLIDSGLVKANNAEAIGVADTQPISAGNRLEDYAKNRRVEIIITPVEVKI